MIHAVPTLLALSFATFSRKLAPENPLTSIFTLMNEPPKSQSLLVNLANGSSFHHCLTNQS
jgi:hypothetical protein